MLFRSAEEAIQAPLAKMLLEMDGVREVRCLSEAMLRSVLCTWEGCW